MRLRRPPSPSRRYDGRLERRHWALVFWCGMGAASFAITRWLDTNPPTPGLLLLALDVFANVAIVTWMVVSIIETHRGVERFRRDHGLPQRGWRFWS